MIFLKLLFAEALETAVACTLSISSLRSSMVVMPPSLPQQGGGLGADARGLSSSAGRRRDLWQELVEVGDLPVRRYSAMCSAEDLPMPATDFELAGLGEFLDGDGEFFEGAGDLAVGEDFERVSSSRARMSAACSKSLAISMFFMQTLKPRFWTIDYASRIRMPKFSEV